MPWVNSNEADSYCDGFVPRADWRDLCWRCCGWFSLVFKRRDYGGAGRGFGFQRLEWPWRRRLDRQRGVRCWLVQLQFGGRERRTCGRRSHRHRLRRRRRFHPSRQLSLNQTPAHRTGRGFLLFGRTAAMPMQRFAYLAIPLLFASTAFAGSLTLPSPKAPPVISTSGGSATTARTTATGASTGATTSLSGASTASAAGRGNPSANAFGNSANSTSGNGLVRAPAAAGTAASGASGSGGAAAYGVGNQSNGATARP